MGEHCCIVATVNLYALITVVGGDNPVLGEDQVDGVAGFPSLQVEGERSVGLCVPLSHLFKPVENIACQGAGNKLGQSELFLLIEKPRHVLVQPGNVNQLQLGGIFLSQLSIFHIKHHESNVLVIIVKLLGLVAELSLHLDDAVEGLVGDHRLEPDIQLQEGSRVTAVQSHLVQPSPGAGLADILKKTPIELECLMTQPTTRDTADASQETD